MRFICKYKVRQYLGEYIIIPAEEDLFNDKALLSLDSFGYFVISLMKQDVTEEEIIHKITNEFEGNEQDLVNSFYMLRDILQKKQLIE